MSHIQSTVVKTVSKVAVQSILKFNDNVIGAQEEYVDEA